jgi:hypothetical protein
VRGLQYSKQRIESVIEEIDRLVSSDFPYIYSKDALEMIGSIFKIHREELNSLTPKNDALAVHAACQNSLNALFIYTPSLGFLLRSTNVRNSFEAYWPLLRLSRQLLSQQLPKEELPKEKIKLILSSEWDYSPFTYSIPSRTADFVFIGLPVPESSNPFLLPLAGHELGHSIWSKRQAYHSFKRSIELEIKTQIKNRWDKGNTFFPGIKDKEDFDSNFLAPQIWAPTVHWALKQAEESFCDFLGLRLFHEAYLHAFAYLFSPNTGPGRSKEYPNMLRRIKNLCVASQRYGVTVPSYYEGLFIDDIDDEKSDEIKFFLSVADLATDSIVPVLINSADTLVVHQKIAEPDREKIKEIAKRFIKHPVPHEDPVSLANILIAAWSVYHKQDLWQKHSFHKDKGSILKDLVLKNIEILEYNQIINERP